jgi:hypothetical protein
VYGGKHSYINKRGIYLGSGFRLKRAFKKYGKENFSVRVLRLQITNEEDMNIKEIRLIRLLRYIFKDKCYNIHKGGSGGDYYKYLTPEERLEVNLRISKSKKLQYSRGETEAQKIGYKKQSTTLKEKNKNDLEYRERMLDVWRNKGRALSDRIRTRGLTVSEIARNKNNAIKQTRLYDILISYPSGNSETITINSKKFKTIYKTDDSMFSTLRKTGMYIVNIRRSTTKHPFPLGTKLTILYT